MLVMETTGKIRRAYFIEKKPIKQVCRDFRMSRNTIRKVIRSSATEFRGLSQQRYQTHHRI